MLLLAVRPLTGTPSTCTSPGASNRPGGAAYPERQLLRGDQRHAGWPAPFGTETASTNDEDVIDRHSAFTRSSKASLIGSVLSDHASSDSPCLRRYVKQTVQGHVASHSRNGLEPAPAGLERHKYAAALATQVVDQVAPNDAGPCPNHRLPARRELAIHLRRHPRVGVHELGLDESRVAGQGAALGQHPVRVRGLHCVEPYRVAIEVKVGPCGGDQPGPPGWQVGERREHHRIIARPARPRPRNVAGRRQPAMRWGDHRRLNGRTSRTQRRLETRFPAPASP